MRHAIIHSIVAVLLAQHAVLASQGTRAGSEIPISLDGNVLVVPLTIRGASKVLRFVVDTGAEITIVNKRTAKALGLPPGTDIDLETVGRETTIPTVELKALRIGSYEAAEVRAASYDLSDLTAAMDSPVDGVLGIDVLSQFSFTIDYGRKTMSISASGAPSNVQGLRFTLTRDSGGYLVPVTLNSDTDVDLLLDTGTNMTQLPSNVWRSVTREWQPRKLLKGVVSSGQEAGHSYLARLDSLQIGNLRIDSPVVRFVLPASTGTFADPEALGLLGSDILRHFVVTIDIPQGHLFLALAPDFHDDPLEFSSIGIQFLKKDRRLFVVGVWEGSPADDLHIQKGDEILEIQGRSVSALASAQVERMLKGPVGSVVSLKFRRGEHIFTLRVPRQKLI